MTTSRKREQVMSETPPSAPGPETGSEHKSSEQSTDGPSTSFQVAERPSLFERLASLFRHRNGSTLREDIADALAETASGDEAAFSPAERAMLNNILRFREVRVEDVMVPRADIEAVELSTTLGELLKLFEQSGHSRMPVYAETLDDPRGMVHIRDVVAHITRTARVKRTRTTRKSAGVAEASVGQADVARSVRKPAGIAGLNLGQVDLAKSIGELSLMRNVLFVPPSMLASDLMARMQATRTQIALVIDEYGGTDGLVSLEDIVEMVVGDIEDEHDDDDEPLITAAGEGVFVVDGKAEIEEVAKAIGEDFSAGEHGENVDTIGGMIFNTLGRVPVRGEVVHAVPGFEFHVLDADPRRVKRVRIVEDPKGERRRRPARTASTEEA
jgi:CBS domain containing-hemolysin-like protein